MICQTFTDLAFMAQFASPGGFDGTACSVTDFVNGGGDRFDCYADGLAVLPAAGTGFSGAWLTAENPFYHIWGDTFDTYADGPAGTMDFDPLSVTNEGDLGFSGDWHHGESVIYHIYGDTFNSYADGPAGTLDADEQLTPATDVIAGFSGAWFHGDAI